MDNSHLYAPWRMEYIRSLADENADGGCFLCEYAAHPDADSQNHVIWRGPTCLTLFNRFPYTNGHLLVAPLGHDADLDDLEDVVLDELVRQVRDAKRLLAETTCAHGFNIGINVGRCAGAGLPEHFHVHLIPRWDGDTSFISVVGDIRVISQSIDALHQQMREAAARLGLPPVRG